MTKKNTKTTTEEIPFLDANDATQDQVNAVLDEIQASLHKTLKREEDFETMIAIATKTNFNIPKEAVSLIRAMQRMMAKQLGFTNRAVQLLCVKHGLSALRPEKMKMILINKQRMTPSARAWVREQQKIENEERENASKE